MITDQQVVLLRQKLKDVVACSICNVRGRRIYVGSTNNCRRKSAQHERDRRLPRSGELIEESGLISRSVAQQMEARKIKGYRPGLGSYRFTIGHLTASTITKAAVSEATADDG